MKRWPTFETVVYADEAPADLGAGLGPQDMEAMAKGMAIASELDRIRTEARQAGRKLTDEALADELRASEVAPLLGIAVSTEVID